MPRNQETETKDYQPKQQQPGKHQSPEAEAAAEHEGQPKKEAPEE